MPKQNSRSLKVFIGCPGDMAPERDLLLSLGKKLAKRGCPVEFLIWPDVPPAAGRPQQVIFDHFPVETWDIFIGLLWNRFGSQAGEKDDRTSKPMTGTEEEFKRAYGAWKASDGRRPHIAVYRCERPDVTKGKGAQIAAVDAFFEQLAAEKDYPALSFSFTDPHKFKDDVEEHLVEIFGKIRATEKADGGAKRTAKTATIKSVDWAAAEETYRRHLCDTHRIVKFHTAEARAPVEVELEKVFIKLMVESQRRMSLESLIGKKDRELLDTDLSDIYRDADKAIFNPWKFFEPKSSVERIRTASKIVHVAKRPIDPSFAAEFSAHFGAQMLLLRAEPQPTTLPDLLRQRKHLLLAGSPGSGKSTLLQYLVLTFASRQQLARLQLDEERLPVFIRLRQFHHWVEKRRREKKICELATPHFAEFLTWQWEEEKAAPILPSGFFRRLLSWGLSSIGGRPRPIKSNAPLILLDGLDEVAEPAERRAIAELVAAALDEWYGALVILTSRPKAWESEGRATIGGRVGEARICNLDDAQIEEFVRHWYLAATVAARGDTPSARGHAEIRAVDLIAAVKPERIRKLAATPLMLAILAMVHSRGVGLPQERSQLYHECIEFMLGYWDEIAGFSPEPELHEVARLDRQTKRQILEPVALWMHRLGSEQIEPLHDDLVKRFAAGFMSVLNEPAECAQRHARAFLRLIVERGGLMQESEAGQFRFVHLTFQEYLAASAIAHGEAPFAQVKDHLHDPWWRELILLAGGELSRQRSYRVKNDTTEWLNGILKADTWAEKYLLRDLHLAAQSCVDMSETGVDPNGIKLRAVWDEERLRMREGSG